MYNTMNNPSAHPSYSHYYLLSPSTLFFVFFFCTSYCFFCTSHCLLHISLSFAHLIVFCTSYCFALFYFIAHFILISPFLTICMPLCYVTYIICILIVLHCHWADLIRLHFTSSYALYNYYVTNKETLNLEPWTYTVVIRLYKICETRTIKREGERERENKTWFYHLPSFPCLAFLFEYNKRPFLSLFFIWSLELFFSLGCDLGTVSS